MQDARLLRLSYDRTTRYFSQTDPARTSFMAANAAAILREKARTVEGIVIQTGVRAETGDPAAIAQHKSALKQFKATFSAEAFVQSLESRGYVFELFPRYKAKGWNFSANKPRGRYSILFDKSQVAVLQGPAREEAREAITAYLVARAKKTNTLPDLKAFNAEVFLRDMEQAGASFILKPREEGQGREFWFSPPDGGPTGMLFQMTQMHKPENRRAIAAALVRRLQTASNQHAA